MIKIKKLRFVRLILSAILLFFVWSNSHWSVALCITLIMVSLEIIEPMLNRLIEILTEEMK